MAKKPIKRVIKLGTKVKENITEENIVATAERNLIAYGSYTIENRAIPEFHDGLKPVHRAVLWSMYNLRMLHDSGFKKSARVTGDVIGKYHPHGSDPVYSAMVNMANLTQPLIKGQGNWGWFQETDFAAADRYTECKLSEYAQACMLQPDYLAVTPMIPNFDGEESLPLYLPALWPNLFINGSLHGIAVGTTSLHPAFTPQSVIKLTQRALEKKIGPIFCAKTLKFAFKYGGLLASDEATLINMFKTGRGRVDFACDLVTDPEKRTITIVGIPHNFKPIATIEKLYELPEVVEVKNRSSKKMGGPNIEITLKRTCVGAEWEAVLTKIRNMTSVPQSFVLNVTDRRGEDDVAFQPWSMPQIISAWLGWRLQLEVKAQTFKRDRLQESLANWALLRKAVDNLEIVFAVLKAKTDNMNALLAQRLEITEDEASYILNQAVRRLGRLSSSDIDGNITRIKGEIKIVKGHIASPAIKVAADLSDAASFFAKPRKAA